MTPPIHARAYATSTAFGAATALAANQLYSFSTKKPNIGLNECIVAVGGAALGNVAKAGINYYFRNNTAFHSNQPRIVTAVLAPNNVIIPIISAAAASLIFALVRRT